MQVLKLAKQLARSKHQVKELESRLKIQERERLQAQEVAYVVQSQVQEYFLFPHLSIAASGPLTKPRHSCCCLRPKSKV